MSYLKLLTYPDFWILSFLMIFIAAAFYPILEFFIPLLAIWVQRKFGFPRNVMTGAEQLRGKEAVVYTPFVWNAEKEAWEGKVTVVGELWSCTTKDLSVKDYEVGASVEVLAVDDLSLDVGQFPDNRKGRYSRRL